MSTSTSQTVLHHQTLPLGIKLLGEIESYAYMLRSIITVMIFWACPALIPPAPRLELSILAARRKVSTQSINTMESSTPTLRAPSSPADTSSDTTNSDEVTLCEVQRTETVAHAGPRPRRPSLPRRLSMPVRRFSIMMLPTPFQPHRGASKSRRGSADSALSHFSSSSNGSIRPETEPVPPVVNTTPTAQAAVYTIESVEEEVVVGGVVTEFETTSSTSAESTIVSEQRDKSDADSTSDGRRTRKGWRKVIKWKRVTKTIKKSMLFLRR